MPQKSAADIVADAKAAYKQAGGGQANFNAPYSLAKTPAPAPAPASKPISPKDEIKTSMAWNAKQADALKQ